MFDPNSLFSKSSYEEQQNFNKLVKAACRCPPNPNPKMRTKCICKPAWERSDEELKKLLSDK